MESYKRIARVTEFLEALPDVERCSLRNQVKNTKWLDWLVHELKGPAGYGLCLECDNYRFSIHDEASLNELLIQLI